MEGDDAADADVDARVHASGDTGGDEQSNDADANAVGVGDSDMTVRAWRQPLPADGQADAEQVAAADGGSGTYAALAGGGGAGGAEEGQHGMERGLQAVGEVEGAPAFVESR